MTRAKQFVYYKGSKPRTVEIPSLQEAICSAFHDTISIQNAIIQNSTSGTLAEKSPVTCTITKFEASPSFVTTEQGTSGRSIAISPHATFSSYNLRKRPRGKEKAKLPEGRNCLIEQETKSND